MQHVGTALPGPSLAAVAVQQLVDLTPHQLVPDLEAGEQELWQ